MLVIFCESLVWSMADEGGIAVKDIRLAITAGSLLKGVLFALLRPEEDISKNQA